MRAYKGIVREGRIELSEGARLPEGAVVTVTVGEAELVRATLRDALRRQVRRRSRGRRWGPVFVGAVREA
jgi:hypothetical protein